MSVVESKQISERLNQEGQLCVYRSMHGGKSTFPFYLTGYILETSLTLHLCCVYITMSRCHCLHIQYLRPYMIQHELNNPTQRPVHMSSAGV